MSFRAGLLVGAEQVSGDVVKHRRGKAQRVDPVEHTAVPFD